MPTDTGNSKNSSGLSGLQTVDLGNLGDAGGNTPTNDFDLDAFFQQMDRDVNGAVFDTGAPAANIVEPPKADPEPSSTPPSEPNEVEGLKKELDELKKRYSDSSAESKRLYSKLQDVEPYMEYVPILQRMREDPGLITTVQNYLSGNTAPVSIKEQLKLPDDFVFDPEDLNDPNSPSARLLNTMVDKTVEHRLANHTRQQKAEQDQQRADMNQREALRTFQDKMKLKDEEMDELVDWARKRQLTMEDIYLLKNREKRELDIARKAIEEHKKQLEKMSRVNPSLASTGAPGEPVNADSEIFGAIKKAVDGGNYFGK
ncbi:MAG: hypothetical protein ACXABY_25000 [Candidatus Thorarchaeota archaeon]|jgi:hypothetical protein